jgi:hypothetical protein
MGRKRQPNTGSTDGSFWDTVTNPGRFRAIYRPNFLYKWYRYFEEKGKEKGKEKENWNISRGIVWHRDWFAIPGWRAWLPFPRLVSDQCTVLSGHVMSCPAMHSLPGSCQIMPSIDSDIIRLVLAIVRNGF